MEIGWLIRLSKFGFKCTEGDYDIPEATWNIIPYVGVIWYSATQRGANRCHKGVRQGDASIIIYIYSSPIIGFPIEW